MSRRFRKKKTKSLTKEVAKLSRAVGTIQADIEVKYVTFLHLFAATPIGKTTSLLHGLLRGDDDGQRIGDHVKLKSLSLNILVAAFGAGNTTFRSILIVDRHNQGALTIVDAQVFTNVATTLDTIISPFNPDFVGKDKKYRILFDSGPRIVNGGTSPNQYMRKHRKHLGMNINYALNNLGTGADIQSSAVRHLFYSTTAGASMGFDSVVTYIDP